MHAHTTTVLLIQNSVKVKIVLREVYIARPASRENRRGPTLFDAHPNLHGEVVGKQRSCRENPRLGSVPVPPLQTRFAPAHHPITLLALARHRHALCRVLLVLSVC